MAATDGQTEGTERPKCRRVLYHSTSRNGTYSVSKRVRVQSSKDNEYDKQQRVPPPPPGKEANERRRRTGKEAPHPQRGAKQNLQPDGGPQDLLDVASDDGNLHHHPQQNRRRPVVVGPAHVCEMRSRHHTKPSRQALKHEAQDVRQQQNPQ